MSTQTTRKSPLKETEDQLHKAVYKSLHLMKVNVMSREGKRLSVASLIHHSPNGGKRESKVGVNGKRYSPEGAKLKAMGAQSGFPDLFIFSGQCGYHGLFVEIKTLKKGKRIEYIDNGIKPEGSKAEDTQVDMITRLNNQNYLAVVAYGYDAIMNIIKDYFDGRIPSPSWLAANNKNLMDYL